MPLNRSLVLTVIRSLLLAEEAALWLALLEVAELLADELAVLVALEAALRPSL